MTRRQRKITTFAMIGKPWLDRVAICLVEPIKAGNVGSVARAMKNMGLSRLVLVNPPDLTDMECRMMSMGAMDIVEKAVVASSVADAVAPFHIAVSTTRRLGQERTPDYTPREFARFMAQSPPDAHAIICFGREDKGLSTEEIDKAPIILTIPSDERCPSLNLAQAVMVTAYELFMAAADGAATEAREPASADQHERLFGQVQPLLLECGFLAPDNPEWIMRTLRKIVQRAQLEYRDVKILRGVCSDMEWYLNHVAEKGERDGQRTVDRSGGA